MGGLNAPQTISVDPTPENLRPLQDTLATIMGNILGAGRASLNEPFPGLTNVMSQLYQSPGLAPGTPSSYGEGNQGSWVRQPDGSVTWQAGGTGGDRPPREPSGVQPPADGGPPVNPDRPDRPDSGGGPSAYPPREGDPRAGPSGFPQQDLAINTRGTFGPDASSFGPFQSLAEPAPISSGSRYNFTPSYQNQYLAEVNPNDLGGGVVPTGGVDAQPPRTTGGAGGTVEYKGSPLGSISGEAAGFDLPMFQGPYAAPLTTHQLDALSGFNQLFDPSQIVNTAQLQGAVQQGLAGGEVFNPSQGPLSAAVQSYDVRSPMQGQIAQSIFNQAQPQSGLSAQQQQLLGLGLQGGQGQSPLQTGGLPSNFQSSFGAALDAPRADLTDFFQTGEDVLSRDLERVMAQTREEASAFGLNPGASDRSRASVEAAGDVLNRFRLGQQQMGINAFQDAEARRLGALGLGAPMLGAQTNAAATAARTPAEIALLGAQTGATGAGGAETLARAGNINAMTQNLGTQNMLSLLPLLQQGDQSAFSNFLSIAEPAAQRAQQTLGMLPTFSNLPWQQAQAMYGIGEAARGIADTELARRQQELARTQGGGLNQILQLFGAAAPQSTGFGPSTLSQVGSLAQGIGSFFIPG